MDAPAPGPRDLAHRAGLQPARRRAARRLRPAAALGTLILFAGGCGGPEEKEDFLGRFLEIRWEDVGAYRPEDLATDLGRYVEGDHPIYPTDDPHCVALHEFLFRTGPDPRGLLSLFGPHGKAEVDPAVLRRDVVASTVATSFMRRIAENPKDPHRAALYDALALVAVHFAFDPAYGDAHTETSVDVGDFFASPGIPPGPESCAAIERHLPALLASWRARATRKGTSMFFGIVLRHLGPAGAEALVREWDGLDVEERKDLLLRLGGEEDLPEGARLALVEALLDPSLEVREAAFAALVRHDAPVEGLEPSAPDDAVGAAVRALRDWARKTKS